MVIIKLILSTITIRMVQVIRITQITLVAIAVFTPTPAIRITREVILKRLEMG